MEMNFRKCPSPRLKLIVYSLDVRFYAEQLLVFWGELGFYLRRERRNYTLFSLLKF
jgi:hypothetical protein